MEEASVEFLMENLRQLRLHQPHLISDVKSQIERLEKSLLLFKRFLKDSSEIREEDETLREVAAQIIKVVYKAEDAVDVFMSQAVDKEVANYFKKRAFDAPAELLSAEEEFGLINEYELGTSSQHVKLVRYKIEVVYKAEYAVDVFVSQGANKEAANYFKKRAFDAPAELLSAVEEVELIGARVGEIYNGRQIDFPRTSLMEDEFGASAQHVKLERNKIPTMREDYMVGFEDETKKLIGYLTEEKKQLDVISIIGIGGLGKTTLARTIFRHLSIGYDFPVRLWVYVSSSYRVKDILLSMLRDLSWITEDMYDKTDREIAQTLCTRLEKEKFLIVLDDVWTTKAWDDLQVAFPKTNNMSKILITTRDTNVAKYANPNRWHHRLRHLNKDESWELLQLLVFGKNKCFSKELEDIGKFIARECQGLPFMIMMVAGVLGKTTSVGEMKVTKSLWLEVAVKMKAFQYKVMDAISLSYHALPCNLKPCFLYLGVFPEDFEIPVQRLILLWIAEGFIQQNTRISLEETAKEYLEDLIHRNLLMIDKVSASGRIKTCRVHDFIKEFCNQTANEYLFREMQEDDGKKYGASLSKLESSRRISILSQNVISFLSSQPYGPRVRSFLHSSREEIILLPENVSAISDAFKLLRVLDTKGIIFTRFPFYLTQLVHLRYIALSSDFKVLPEAISKLWNIQTIIIFTSSRVLEIKADILKMIYLRHLETNASIILRKQGESGNGGNIQVLANLSPESCTGYLFEKANNLKKLGIRGRLTILLDDKSGSSPFDNLGKLHQLENLKLLNDMHIYPDEAKLPHLPPPHKFPPNLISLTLSYTLLEWEQMSVLGMLEHLRVLKLKNSAFKGECWEVVDGGFHQLEVLHIQYTNLVKWEASSHHFPKLQHLKLRNCEELEALPFSLAEISSLQIIDLYRTTKSAAASARIIQNAIEFPGGRLKLSIFPIDE